MRRHMLKAKIHRATVTEADLNYVGSITIDSQLMELADILEGEQVMICDIDNGARLQTYAIPGGSGQIVINGAATHLVSVGDKITIMAFADYDETELLEHEPNIVTLDASNQPALPQATLRSVRPVP